MKRLLTSLPEVTKVTWAKWTNSRHCCITFGVAGKADICIVYFDKLRNLINHLVYSTSWFLSIKSKVNTLGFLQFLPSGQHGLCFGYLFSGPFPLRSHIGSPPFGVCFRESLVFRLYSEIDQIHLSIEAQCGTAYLPMGDCHRSHDQGPLNQLSHWVT